MRYYGVPGVSIAVVNDGKLEWAKGYGIREAGATDAVTTETLFQAASISKALAAMAALALVQDGRLDLDENVNLKLKSWLVPENEFTKEHKVTLRRLLSHSAGVNVEDVGSYASYEAVPTLLQALDARPPAESVPIRVESVPGKQFRYSGGGYSVIQQLLTDVAGKPFPVVVQELVFTKIGMVSSTFRQPLPSEMARVAASGHDVMGQPLQGRWYTFPQTAAAGLWTTPSDLARFVIEVQESVHGRSNVVLRQALTKQMMTPQLGGYGLSLWLGGNGKVATFSHPGRNEGFTCMLFAYVEAGQGAVVMTNGDGGNSLFNEILRAVAHEYGWPDYRPRQKAVVPTNAALFGSYVGAYEVAGIRVTITTNGQELYVVAPPVWPQRLTLYPSGKDTFFPLEEDADLTFVRGTEGRIVELRAVASGQTVTAKKVN
jgi:CubicO group peptidase (beta-lactamase class C family)